MKITKKNLEKLIIEELEALLSEQPRKQVLPEPVRDPKPEQPPGDPEQRHRRRGGGGSRMDDPKADLPQFGRPASDDIPVDDRRELRGP